jgi:hypothetical protein
LFYATRNHTHVGRYNWSYITLKQKASCMLLYVHVGICQHINAHICRLICTQFMNLNSTEYHIVRKYEYQYFHVIHD